VGATQLTQLAKRLEKTPPDMLRMKAAQWIEQLLKVSQTSLDLLDRQLGELTQANTKSSAERPA